MYLERKTKRIFGIACLGKRFVFQSEISTFSLILFSKTEKFYRIKDFFKVNQILSQTKKLVFHTEICNYFN